MRFWIERAGVPIGTAELEVHDRVVGVFEPLSAYAPEQVVFREGANALWDLLTRPRQSTRGRRWRARLVERMHRQAHALTLRTPSGISVAAARVFLWDSTRLPGPPMAVVHFDEAPAGSQAEVTPLPAQSAESSRPAAKRSPAPNERDRASL